MTLDDAREDVRDKIRTIIINCQVLLIAAAIVQFQCVCHQPPLPARDDDVWLASKAYAPNGTLHSLTRTRITISFRMQFQCQQRKLLIFHFFIDSSATKTRAKNSFYRNVCHFAFARARARQGKLNRALHIVCVLCSSGGHKMQT